MRRQEPEDDDLVPMLPLLLTLSQASELCQVGIDRMREWSHEPGFPVIRTSQQVRIHRELLNEWLKKRARGEVAA